ncbi:cobalamin biosynthesis protein [Phaeobacter sp. B1627]|uniref:cobalamin biosynthesis protein n=1 Tax=Phaeobacter sp. B1627 TaxID=2583809 RepID=UPI001117F26D|nr:cobalamin biosynthesis protein [Phaeobacter sp. B1627]TNJ41296.1 precorrin methylase [Phaeobacter sp. B1627]
MIIAGIGFSSRVTAHSLTAALAALTPAPAAIAVLRTKAEVAQFQDFARAAVLPVIPVDDTAISGVPTPSFSPRIHARFNTGSVAEALALVAAGRHGAEVHLIQTRRVTADGHATVAIAETMTS